MMTKWGRELTILAALAMLSGYLSLTQPNFRDAFTLSTILTNAAYVGVVGVGMTMVIVAGQIDISVGSLLAWIGWAAVLAAAFMLAHTIIGREVYALGSSPQAARLAGIDTARVTFWVFALSGLLVGLATMLHVTRFSMVQTQEGLGLEFLVITAVVVGGTNIFGGSGTVAGTYLGVLLLTVTSSALTFLGISATWDQAIRGAFILVAVTADIVRTGRWRQPVGWAR